MAPGNNDIRYVCLSDLHLGEEDSLLTHVDLESGKADPSVRSPVLQELATCLIHLISKNENQTQKPSLILMGDVLELALTTDNIAAMAFERFIELFMAENYELFEKIIYIPGNHDHHLWESARETQYVLNYLPKTKPQDALEPPWHATNIFMEDDPNPVPSFFLNGVVHRYPHLKNFDIHTAYPNFGLMHGKRCVLFHHGHFIESLYQLMTTLKNMLFPELKKRYREIWDLESENFAWIDFFWSTLGRSGDWGQDVETIYEKMQDEEQFRRLTNNLAHSLAEQYDITGLGDQINDKVGEVIVNALVNKVRKTERTQGDQLLSKDAEDGLVNYLNFPLQKQLDKECTERHNDQGDWYFPDEVTFVFGHTHKPFEALWKFRAYSDKGVPVYNTGGWVVETVNPAPLHGGAAVLLNENLDCASLRFYNEADDPEAYQMAVNEVLPPGQGPSSFFQRLRGMVRPEQIPWSRFSQMAAKEVSRRAQKLKERISS
jgi:hypothetical protein